MIDAGQKEGCHVIIQGHVYVKHGSETPRLLSTYCQYHHHHQKCWREEQEGALHNNMQYQAVGMQGTMLRQDPHSWQGMGPNNGGGLCRALLLQPTPCVY